jgi:fructose-bisphosphate aldolase, class II
MLINGRDLLGVANENNFAIPAFNVSDYAMGAGLFELCDELQSPWILAIHPDEVNHIGEASILALRELAHRSSVPVAIHWDHGGSYNEMLTAIQAGFTSVMIDKSMLSFDENVAITKKVVETAHAVGLSVEGELGTIGKTDGYAEGGTDDIIYTVPEDAVRFVELTGVDSLAIAIGTRHGLYPSDLTPKLELGLLKDIKAAVPIPLVLHGGSNNPDDEIGIAAQTGINKINISSDIKVAYFDKMREVLQDTKLREPNMIEPPCVEAMNVVAKQKIELFGSLGKASLYGRSDVRVLEPAL